MIPRLTETWAGAMFGAVLGLAQWGLSVQFHGHPPAALTGAVYVIIPGAFGGFVAFFTRRTSKLPVPAASDPAPEA